MSRLFFTTHAASNPSFPARTASTNFSYPKAYIRLVAGIVTIFTLEKPNEVRAVHERKTEHSWQGAYEI